MIGSLYSGIGGLDLACEWATGLRTAWQLDLTGADIRRRHWPDALQVEADVATVDPLDLPRVSVLCAGFACQDLSVAGPGEARGDLDMGERTGPTWRGVVRFAEALRPDVIVLENVPALMGRIGQVERALSAWGWTWVRARVLDAGAPHLRARVFGVGVLGAFPGGVLDVPRDRKWRPDAAEREWPPPTVAGNYNREGLSPTSGDGLETAVRPWPTPMQADGLRGSATMMRGNATLPGAVRPWATPRASDARSPGPCASRNGSDSLACEVRPWPTVTARDYKSGDLPNRVGTEALSPAAAHGRRLSPEWVECLMGYPEGWTLPDGPLQVVEQDPRWPRGRYPASWDRSVHWPGYEWEPARTVPDGPPMRGRPARIRALGNAVVPQQGALAVRTGLCRITP